MKQPAPTQNAPLAAGMAGTARSRDDILHSLVDVALFEQFTGPDMIRWVWAHPHTAAHVLQRPENRLPQTPADMDALLNVRDQARRQAAVNGARRAGETYAVRYGLSAFDGTPLLCAEKGERTSEGTLLCALRIETSDAPAVETSTSQTSGPAVQAEAVTANDLVDLITRKRLALHYQPIVDALSGYVHAYEALLRVHTETDGYVSAAPYILAAERLGAMHWLDQAVPDLVADKLKARPDVRFSINISAGTLNRADGLEDWFARLAALGRGCERLTIELTETMAPESYQAVDDFICRIREMGCRFAIDDFGVGHTSFARLKQMRPDVVKIDGAVIEGVASSPAQQAHVRMITGMAEDMGFETVAERVSGAEDARYVAGSGVDFAQGWFYGRPEPL